jgi:ATP-dependent DNA helicase RecG
VLEHRLGPPGKRRAPARVLVEDESSDLTLVFFNADKARIESMLPKGSIRYISGKIELWDGTRQMVHPDRVLDENAYQRMPPYEPIYPLTAGLTQRGVGKTAEQALSKIPALPEWQDAEWMRQKNWPSFADSLKSLHRPTSLDDVAPLAPARLRLAYDELLASQLALLLMRARMKRQSGASRAGDGKLVEKLKAGLPFTLTNGQEKALADIRSDLAAPERMLRLVQGDVGSGKTVVALLAMASAIEAGWQAALMAPTEILARQHYERLAPLAEKVGITCAVLTGREKGASRQNILKGLADGTIQLVIGTHALFQDAVAFHMLGIAVIDEQHRFGVHQRLALSRKGEAVDVLVMTATPIPRTLVLTYFGDMDVSIIREKPAGRKPIETRALPLERLDDVANGLGRALQSGQRIYWVCPLVSESEDLDLAAAEERAEALRKLYGDQVGLMHGQMKSVEKDLAMADFASGKTRILVSTTVIEVGVDVPEATIMIIEHAERFGLSQLHQLRGRVGRGAAKSSCVLLYGPLGETGRARMETMRRTEDGFEIAEEDLRLRGEGEVLGTRQSGLPDFKLAVPEKHNELLEAARDDAKLILTRDEKLQTDRGEAVRMLLYLFEKDAAIGLIRAG